MKILPKILVVDDDKDILNWIDNSLSLANCTLIDSFREAKELIEQTIFDLIILDLNLDEGNGFTLLKHIASTKNQGTPAIIVTASPSENDEIEGLNLGVREYIQKPLRPKTFKARVKKILKETYENEKSSIEIDTLKIDLKRMQVLIDNEQVELTIKEYKILLLLTSNREMPFSRESIFDKIWDIDSESLGRTIDMHVSSLRKKIKQYGPRIKTVRSVGYKFE